MKKNPLIGQPAWLAAAGLLGSLWVGSCAATTVSLLPAVADSYVRDGRYAFFNFGNAGTLAVKKDNGSYNRVALLKFDLSKVSGIISSAKLKLVPVSVGRRLDMVHQLYLTADDSWTETDVNWNNRPRPAALLASWPVPAADNTPIEIDVSAAAKEKTLLSLEIKAAADYGEDGAVDYASRSHGNAKYRPVLVITSD